MRTLIYLVFCLLWLCTVPAHWQPLRAQAPAQEPGLRIELGKTEIGLNEQFTITVVSEDGLIREHSKFPDIEGLTKAGRSSSTTSTSVQGGPVSVSQRLVQLYTPTREGKFRLRPFSMRINGKSVDGKEATITVVPAAPPSAAAPPAADASEEPQAEPEELHFEPNESAFLNLSASKKSVYVGEGVLVQLAFYVSFADRNLLNFHEFARQLQELPQKIRPTNAWEERFENDQVEPEVVEIDGKPFLRFRLFEAMYYPLSPEPLLFASQELQMVRYIMLRNPSLFGPARRQELKSYYSAPLIVQVQQLPPHPLREQVAVGQYRLRETAQKTRVRTGQGFQYQFQIEGEGNIAAINAPYTAWPAGLSTYPPGTRQEINRGYGRVQGYKSFQYFITPREPGTYRFRDFAHWIYFNPATARYDTLQAQLRLEVTGPSSRNATIANADLGTYYDAIARADNDLQSMAEFDRIKLYANFVLLALLLILVFLYFKK